MKNITFSEEITLEAHNLKNDGNLNNKPYKKILINSKITPFLLFFSTYLFYFLSLHGCLEGEDIHVSPHLTVKCLKSLKDRFTWKPSDEQMEVLNEVIRNPYLSTAEYNGLIALREQFKAL